MFMRSVLVVAALAAASAAPAPAGGEVAPLASAATQVAGPQLVAGPAVRVPGTVGGGDRPAVVVDDAGRATAVWRQTYRSSDGTRVHTMMAARRGIGGRWSEPTTVGCAPPEECAGKHPQVGVNAAGVVTAAWSDGSTVMAVRRPARRSWQHATSLGRGRWTQGLATSATGAAVVVAARRHNEDLWAARYLPGHGWGAWRRLARNGVEGTAVAMGPRGAALVLKDVTDANGVYGRDMTRQGSWGPWREVSVGEYEAWAGDPVIDTAGIKTVAYLSGYRQHGGEYYGDDGKVSRARPGGPWRPTALVPNSGAWSVQLVVNRRNDLALAFGGHTLLRPHGATWSAPVRSHNGVLAVLAHGSAMRLWFDDSGLMVQRIHEK